MDDMVLEEGTDRSWPLQSPRLVLAAPKSTSHTPRARRLVGDGTRSSAIIIIIMVIMYVQYIERPSTLEG